MLKAYEGWGCPNMDFVRFNIDWSFPACLSEQVALDPQDTRELFWCDGGPSTEDYLRFWVCNDCGHRAEGRDMRASASDVVVLYGMERPRPDEKRMKATMILRRVARCFSARILTHWLMAAFVIGPTPACGGWVTPITRNRLRNFKEAEERALSCDGQELL